MTPRLAVSIVCVLLCAAATSRADDAGDAGGAPALTFATTAASRYLFQGLDYSASRPVLQPQLGASWRGNDLTLWGNGNIDHVDIDEVDATLGRTLERKAASVTGGLVHLHYPNRDWAPTNEVFAEAALHDAWSPDLTVHYDFTAGRGVYAALAVTREVPNRVAALQLTVRGYAQSAYYGMTGVPAVETCVAFSRKANGLTFSPAISRFTAWPNGTFRGADAVRSSWLLAVGVARGD